MDNLSELKAMPIWVCWNKIEKNGRMTLLGTRQQNRYQRGIPRHLGAV